MLHLRRALMLLLVVMTTLMRVAPGQKIEKDGLPEDKYNLEEGLQGDARPDQGFAPDEPSQATGSEKTKKPYQPIPLKYVVTEEVFFDIMIGNKTKTQDPYYGRIQIACFGEIVPITCLNFIALAKGYRKGREWLSYKNSPVHRVIRDFVIQMGDITGKKGKSGKSIYGATFEDENFRLSHRGAGWVSMANHGRNTNGSQFFVLLQPARWLDGKHVVFGKVIKGMDTIRKLSEVQTSVTGHPKMTVKIVDCGVVGITSKYEIDPKVVMSDGDIAS